jgi:2-methylcitrate dehydratase PrpD
MTEEAQFNTAWPLAVYLLDGELGPRQILEYRLQDPKVRELASRIDLEESPELSELQHLAEAGDPKGGFFAIAEITLKDGRVLRSAPADAGVKFAGWTEEEVERKFRWLLKDIVEPERIDRLVDLVWHFESAPDVHELVRLATMHQVPAWMHA